MRCCCQVRACPATGKFFFTVTIIPGAAMTNKNLSTVTTDLIESYGNTARNIIQAYRVGNRRAVHFVDQRWENALLQSASQLRSEVRKNALVAQRTISGIFIKGIDLTSSGADIMVGKAVELAGKGVQQVAENANAFEKRTGVATLNNLAKATVPAVVVVSHLAGKLEQGSSRLANSVAGKNATVRVAVAKRKTASAGTKVKGTTARPAAASRAPRKSTAPRSPVRKNATRKTASHKAPATSAAA